MAIPIKDGRLHSYALLVSLVATSVCWNSNYANSQSSHAVVITDVVSLCKLVENMRVVALKYHYDPDTAPARELHPYAVGYTPSKNVLLFGLQVDGYSQSAQTNSAKGWRNFRADKIKTLIDQNSNFVPVQPQLPDRKIIAKYECKNKLVP